MRPRQDRLDGFGCYGRRTRPIGIAGLAAAALLSLLVGCGGSGGNSSTTTPAPTNTESTTSTTATSQAPHRIHHQESPGKLPGSPAAFVRTALTTSDPKLACQAYTPAALEKSYGGESGCEAAIRSGGAADSVEIKGVYSGQQTAAISAVPSGGPSDSETVKISLVQQGGAWRIASLHSNVPVGP